MSASLLQGERAYGAVPDGEIVTNMIFPNVGAT